MKLVAWALEPDTLEEIFKLKHDIGTGAEIIAVKSDDTTGLVMCVFGVSDEVFSSLASGHEVSTVDPSENYN